MLHDLRSRPAVNALLCLLSALAVLTSVLGPLLLGAIAQSTLRTAQQAASAADTSITVSLDYQADGGAVGLDDELSGALDPAADGPAARLWGPRQVWSETTENLAWAESPRTGMLEAVARARVVDGRCAGLPLATGRCPVKGQALVSAVDARQRGLTLGSPIAYRTVGANTEHRLRVSGTYEPDQVAAPLTRPGTDAGTTASVTADPVVISAEQAAELPVPFRLSARLPLRPGLALADTAAVRESVTAVNAAVLERSLDLVLTTGVVDLLDRVDVANADARVLVLVVEVQALALALFAVAVVLQRVARSRTAEWAVGRLRGVPRRRWLSSLYAEPAVALLAGVPVGLAAGLVVARLSVAATLSPGLRVELGQRPVLLSAAATVLGLLVTLAAVSVPSLRRPLVELLAEGAERRRLSPLGAAAQAVVVLGAAASLYELRLGGVLSTRGSQLGLLAPALFTLALAVVTVRVAVLVVRRATSRPPRTLTALVVGRQAVRTPSALNPAIAVAVGVALAVFASQVLLLSVRNQDLRARAEVGADTVLHVAVPAGVDLVEAVRSADPSGRYAMAAEERAAGTDRGTARMVAVDSSRLAAVTSWSPSWSGVEDLAAALHPPTPAPIVLRGTRVAVELSSVRVSPGEVSILGTAEAHPVLTLTVDTGRAWQTVQLGAIDSATRLRGRLDCRAGCRLVGFALVSAPGAPYQATVTIETVATEVEPAAASRSWLGGQGRWHARVGGDASAQPVAQASPAGYDGILSISARDEAGGNAVMVSPSDAIDPLPAVLAPATVPDPFPGIDQAASGNGLDGQPQLIRVVGHAAVLPRSTGDGVLVDLVAAQRLSDPADDGAVREVWLAPGTPPAVEESLTASGIRVDRRERLADRQGELQLQPSTRAAAASVWLAFAAMLLALVALAAARVADFRRRRADWRSLREAGLPVRAIRRLAFAEILTPALLGTLLGVAGGVGALVLAAGRLPLVDLRTAGPPLDLAPSWPAVGLVAVGVSLLLVVGAAVASAAEARDGGPP